MSSPRASRASFVVGAFLLTGALAWGAAGCSSDDGTPLLDCNDGGCGSPTTTAVGPGTSSGGATAAGNGGTDPSGGSTGNAGDDGGGTSVGTTSPEAGGAGNILPTDSGSAGSLPTGDS